MYDQKICITGILASLAAFLGVTGWLWLLWVLCLLVDYFTGTVAACRARAWSSDIAQAGIWGKLGSMIVVLVTAALDFVIGQVLGSYALPFSYTMLLCPIVLAWYILTEVGSILENAARLGAQLPPFLVRWLKRAVVKLENDSES